jgi:hypothetical protein
MPRYCAAQHPDPVDRNQRAVARTQGPVRRIDPARRGPPRRGRTRNRRTRARVSLCVIPANYPI